ncbi:hypothetical protein HYC85_023928 [Camellia sinensis]|uniref:CBM-cenC domain-containing protein n=1 Tax=Camellia sinensis TaxID=4442 RepID=A0A7J7GFW8_CAMSI|nr:hypothetical protein HYC85_023928 [Camellia sinensis]
MDRGPALGWTIQGLRLLPQEAPLELPGRGWPDNPSGVEISDWRRTEYRIEFGSGEAMENPSASNANNFHSEKSNGNTNSSRSSVATNVLMNHDFSKGLDSWHSNCCDAFIVSAESGNGEGLLAKSDSNYAVITNRKECWQGLEQDITGKVSPGSTYTVSARVGVSGPLQSFVDVLATLKLEYQDSATSYLFIGRVLSTGCFTGDENIILNPRFEDGLNNWSGRGCKIVLHESMGDGKIMPMSGKFFASATERTQSWNGIQQEITARVQRKLAYEITAIARIFGNNVTSADLRATLWVQTPDLREQYIGIANLQATDKDWVQLQGKFLLNASPSRVVIYLEGPPPGTDILLNSLVVKHADKVPPSPPPDFENVAYGVNILTNGNLHDGTNGWFPLGSCTLSVGTGSPHILPPMARDSLGPQEPLSGRYILVTNRTQTWMGPAQMITDNLKLYLTYQVSAWVRIGSTTSGPQNVNVALSVDNQWVNGGQVELNDDRWHEIGGSFRIEKQPNKVMVYVQGPAPGVDLMVGGFQIFPG